MAVQAVDAPSPAMQREARPNLERPGVLRRYPQFTISPAILVALIAAWWLATHVAGVPAYVMPPPEQVLHALIGGLGRAPWDKAGYWYHAGITVWEALLGFAIGSALSSVSCSRIGPSSARAGIPTLSASNRCRKSRSRR